MKNKILYIGNDLAKKSKYNSTMETLSTLFVKEGFVMYRTSDKLNKVLRLFEMCFSIVKYRNKVNFILIDTFSTSNFYYAFFTSQIARLLRIRYVPILHGGNLPKRLQKSPFMSKLIFKNSHKNIAPSNYLKTEFENKGFWVELIPNVLEIENYKFKERPLLNPTILWVRAFKEMYNPKMAIHVLSKVKKEFKEAKLCMIGPIIDDSYKETIELIDYYKLNDEVEITGVLPKELWHKKSINFDVFINTTNFDNTPVSVMEAMALGIPIISTNAGGIPDLINNRVDGIVVRKDDVDNMAKEIIQLLKVNDISLSINARQKVEKFSWDYVKDQWKEVLK